MPGEIGRLGESQWEYIYSSIQHCIYTGTADFFVRVKNIVKAKVTLWLKGVDKFLSSKVTGRVTDQR